ncbi:MAG: hypothetical protein P8P74_17775 [Crocinitomicaceae bacterium]|nr:hypothetical protein [Crocinitomicaceae bacterium]
MKTITAKIAFGLLLTGSLAFLNQSCNTTKEIIKETVEEVTENTEEASVEYLYRLRQCTLDSGKVKVSPVTANSIKTENIHVITHGWAPGYLKAVNDYASNHGGQILLAWDSLAVNSSNERFFVPTFFNLAASILNADPGSTVLVFSWIDQSATSESGDLWKDWGQMCQAEDNTQIAADEMYGALSIATDWSVNHQFHLLGHSYGTKVVSHTAIGLKRKMDNGSKIERIQLSLFDSPEKAPVTCANNDLCSILPAFEPNRNTRFVANYISYYDKCLSSCDGLEWVVDATIFPHRDYCQRMSSIEKCISCKHEAGVVWYTDATNAPSFETGLWWTPMKSLRLSESIVQYHVKKYENRVKMDNAPDCQAGQIKDCEE